MYVIQGQREKSYLYIQKGHFVKSVSCGYNIVIISPLAFQEWGCYYNDKEEPRRKRHERTLTIEQPFLGNDTILAKYAMMAKTGACQKMETPAVVAVERYPKIGNPILYSKW